MASSAVDWGEVHVDGIQLLHRGHLRGGRGFDQGAFRDQRLADAARDGRSDVGVAQVDGRVVLRGLGGRHGGVGLAERRHGVVVFLLADGVGLDQRRIAVSQQLGAEEIRLRLLELRRRLIVGGLIGRRIDLEQQLVFLDVAALLEGDLLDDAGHARTDLRIAHGIHAARQFGNDGSTLRLHGNDADLGHAGVHLGLFAASRQYESEDATGKSQT